MQEQDWLTIREAAARIGVHYQTIRNWIQTGQLDCMKRGRTVRISRAALEVVKKKAG